MPATPTYKICEDKKSGVLIDPNDVTVVGLIEEQVKTQNSLSVSSVQVAAQTSSCRHCPYNYVSAKNLQDLDDKWVEHFAHFKALLAG